jgi:hypothetical protein
LQWQRLFAERKQRKEIDIPLSNNSVKRRIYLISKDILDQVITSLEKSGQFSLQTDESVDIGDNPQLMVFVRYKGEVNYLEEFLFCSSLSTITRGEDIFQLVDNFFKEYALEWTNCLAVCTDGATSTFGSRTGFCARVEEESQRCSDSLLLAPGKFTNQRNAARPQRCHPNREFHQK